MPESFWSWQTAHILGSRCAMRFGIGLILAILGCATIGSSEATASSKRTIYLSTDVETDGPIPGQNSMLSFASAAYLEDKTLLSTFSANLELLPGATPDPKTMEWWKTQPTAWDAHRRVIQQPQFALANYLAWLKSLDGDLVFVAYPVTFDFMFVYWYLIRFTGESPFAHRGLDIRSYAMGMLGSSFRGAAKEHLPPEWFDPAPHTHEALDDAIEQGALFINMLQANQCGRFLTKKESLLKR